MRACLCLMLCWVGCNYGASYRDCFVSCQTDGTCPGEMSCVAGLCRAAGATASCSDVLGDAQLADTRDPTGDGGRDAAVPDAARDAATGTPDYYGCYPVADNTATCTSLCASEGHTCSTGCSGSVWYAYSLAGPCSAGQPTNYSGSSCSQAAVIGTGHTIYVACCCQ